jgi:hypothetical protein
MVLVDSLEPSPTLGAFLNPDTRTCAVSFSGTQLYTHGEVPPGHNAPAAPQSQFSCINRADGLQPEQRPQHSFGGPRDSFQVGYNQTEITRIEVVTTVSRLHGM